MTVTSYRKWFNKSDEVLEPLRKLCDNRRDWLEDVDSDEALVLCNDPDALSILYRHTKQDVETKIEKYISMNEGAKLHEDANTMRNQAAKKMQNWNQCRNGSRARKANTDVQRTLSFLGEFLKSFTGVADIVRAADQTFGGLAYGTLMLLVTTAVNKQSREDAIEEAMEELALAFPRLETIQRLEPNDILRRLIVEVFEHSVCFCRETITYFSKRSRRLKDAMSPSPLKINTLSRLRRTLLEIRKECDIMMIQMISKLGIELQGMKQQLDDMERTGADTNFRIKRADSHFRRVDSRDKASCLEKIKNLLALKRSDGLDSAPVIVAYKTSLLREFADHRRKNRVPSNMSLKALYSEPSFLNWQAGARSSILLLGGNNFKDDSSIQYNWLSLASILMAEDMEDSATIVSLFCQTEYTPPRMRRRRFPDVIRHLIYQLAEQHQQALKDSLEDISRIMEALDKNNGNQDESIEYIFELLIPILGEFDNGSDIRLVIDRLDQCFWHDDRNTEQHSLDRLFGSLLQLIQATSLSKLRIKILLVMDEDPARKLANKFTWAKDRRRLDYKVDWHQEADDD